MEKDTQHSKLLATGKIPNHLCEATFYLKESRGIILYGQPKRGSSKI